ncbi:MAG: hypothetical protein QOK44_43 [Betaproteobacteria bacterium]|jgi:hypothetical protein|nr:hypothetical protein [Betaproteobacteria bacterium]
MRKNLVYLTAPAAPPIDHVLCCYQLWLLINVSLVEHGCSGA